MTTEEIDERAAQMNDDEREQYITARGWAFMGAGWFPPAGPEDQEMGGRIRHMPSGMYSLSTAIREQLAREDPDAKPNHLGRYYHGTVEYDPRPAASEPAVTASCTDAQALADGVHIDLTRLERARLDGLPQFNGRPVVRVTDSLILALVRQFVKDARDIADDGELGGWLYESSEKADGEEVWIQDHGDVGGWTVMLASDY